jgi:hypothetical protein
MRRFPFFGALMLLPAFALVFLVGCPGPAKDKDKKAGDGAVAADAKGGDKGQKAGATVEITANTDGDIVGFVKYKGAPPDPKPLPAIAAHKDAAACMAGAKVSMIEVVDQTWLVKDGKLANVAVYLAPPSGKKFKITDALKKPFDKAVVVDQPFCQYVPHVSAIYAGIQPFAVKNSAEVGHNVKIVGNKNPPTDDNLKPKSDITPERKYEKETGPINLSCSIHNWMNAKLLTFDHPYFAVSKEDGSFTIKNAPVGEELAVWIWHESMGAKGIEAQKVTLKKGENKVELEVTNK